MSYCTVAQIDMLTERFKDIEVELYTLRRSLCPSPTEPQHEDWNFTNLEPLDPDRVSRLTAAGDPSALLTALEGELREAITEGTVRFGVDCNKGNRRAIFQFPVARDIYDWFFNGRTGYRAQFWAGPVIGDRHNRRIVQRLRNALEGLPEEIIAREIDVEIIGAPREEIDKGPVRLRRETVLKSLDPQVAKIWICERLIQTNGSNPHPTLAAEIAQRHLPKLEIPRWASAEKDGHIGEGVRAPYPEEPSGWLDLKGGFIGSDEVYQLKCPTKRSNDLCERGWT
jgi:hypothetical protein